MTVAVRVRTLVRTLAAVERGIPRLLRPLRIHEPASALNMNSAVDHALCCKSVWVSFWSSWLPARSLAVVVTTAL
jgi:hypothetical protein